ncbi:hypothetical protein [Streptomyces sp. NPDC051109]|uniref:hypothetical protein n=1 Tax=Streptomyces sp. NPDC051109 TaxID=3365642 RepID=UPI0037A10293
MGALTGIDFTFDTPIDTSAALRKMQDDGISFIREGGASSLFDENGMFDWKDVSASSLPAIIAEMGDVRWANATVGISLLLRDSQRGGDLLFHPGRSAVSFMATINRKPLSDSSRFCDVGWYLNNLVPILEGFGLREVEVRDSV